MSRTVRHVEVTFRDGAMWAEASGVYGIPGAQAGVPVPRGRCGLAETGKAACWDDALQNKKGASVE